MALRYAVNVNFTCERKVDGQSNARYRITQWNKGQLKSRLENLRTMCKQVTHAIKNNDLALTLPKLDIVARVAHNLALPHVADYIRAHLQSLGPVGAHC